MSLDAIQKVTETEQASQVRRAEADAAAKNLIAQTRQELEARNKALMQQAQARADQATEQTLAQARKQAEELCRAAEGKLDAAADLIVRRVVSG